MAAITFYGMPTAEDEAFALAEVQKMANHRKRDRSTLAFFNEDHDKRDGSTGEIIDLRDDADDDEKGSSTTTDEPLAKRVRFTVHRPAFCLQWLWLMCVVMSVLLVPMHVRGVVG